MNNKINKIKNILKEGLFVEESEADEIAIYFINEGKIFDDLVFKLYLFCSEETRLIIKNGLTSKSCLLDISTLSKAIEYGIYKYDAIIREKYIKEIKRWNRERKIDEVTKDNPLVCMVWLHILGFISVLELERIEKHANNSNMISFFTHTRFYDIDQFDENWSFVLRSVEYKKKYERLVALKEREKMIERIKIYREQNSNN